ncbi:hypothetical protein [Flavobacterium silvaticum]|uniref:Uncharacterized protein n=1 Tax=Flavobacterium silvaticum TaxID=1852020 RepID=A0A972FUP5_9FLAO|nr:hypothetical protein [Flavobacterium silvaticum]NMH28387.1 hypothetical protein [Flavobacterium silvaticum]
MNASLPKINVIYRSCDAVNAVHNAPRPFGLDKKTLIKVCFKSLHDSLQGFNYSITVLGDNLSAEMKEFFLKFDVELIEGVFGNDASIRETIKIAERFNDQEWVYFCEDDYLHKPETFEQIVNLIQVKDSIIPARIQFKQLLRKRELTLFSMNRYFTKPNLVIHPCDYPDRYHQKYAAKNFIFHTQKGHWRQISDMTFTFLIEVHEVKKHKKTLIKASHRANDRYLSKTLFGKSVFINTLLGVSPMPSLSTHMHIETMSPLVNWEQLVNQLLIEI